MLAEVHDPTNKDEKTPASESYAEVGVMLPASANRSALGRRHLDRRTST